MKKKIFGIVVFAVLFWIFSLALNEVETFVFKGQFSGIAEFEEFNSKSNFVKIINYTPKEATIYFVYRDKTMGNTVSFNRVGKKWKYDYWDTVWSTSGSADKTIWPYWWHFFYSHRRL